MDRSLVVGALLSQGQICAQAPFFASNSQIFLKPQATVKVGFFYRPTKAKISVKNFSVLAAGKVLRVPCRGAGGRVALVTEHHIANQLVLNGTQVGMGVCM